MAVPSLVRPFLAGSLQRLCCDAVAWISAAQDQLEVLYSEDADREVVRQRLTMTADTFVRESCTQVRVLIRNRVRFEENGPLLGRFIVAPVLTGEGSAAALCFVRSAEAQAFSPQEGAAARRPSAYPAR